MRWLSEHLTGGPAYPDDWIANKVHSILANDDTLQRIFGADWIRRTDVYAPIDFDHFPQLVVATGLSSDTPQVGVISDQVTVYLIVRFRMAKNEPLRPGEPGLASLWRHVKRLLLSTGNVQLNHRKVDGNVVQAAKRSESGRVLTTPEQELDGGEFAFRSVLEWVYQVSLDASTQEIVNLRGEPR